MLTDIRNILKILLGVITAYSYGIHRTEFAKWVVASKSGLSIRNQVPVIRHRYTSSSIKHHQDIIFQLYKLLVQLCGQLYGYSTPCISLSTKSMTSRTVQEILVVIKQKLLSR